MKRFVMVVSGKESQTSVHEFQMEDDSNFIEFLLKLAQGMGVGFTPSGNSEVSQFKTDMINRFPHTKGKTDISTQQQINMFLATLMLDARNIRWHISEFMYRSSLHNLADWIDTMLLFYTTDTKSSVTVQNDLRSYTIIRT